jgi:hydroxyacyl-ACP dehydratase HTD2-like protein with hotdog domain
MPQTYFEDVTEGHLLEPLTFGPLTTTHLMRWSAAIENWHKIHYDRSFATQHDKLPDLLINGSLKQQFIVALLKRWAGAQGWVWKVRFEMRAMSLVGETLTAWARVTGKHRSARYGLVEAELGTRNEVGIESTPGSATIALPYRGGDPVPYPFVPPAD